MKIGTEEQRHRDIEIADIILFEHPYERWYDPIPLIIQLGTKCKLNHMGIIVNQDGDFVHASRGGVKVQKITMLRWKHEIYRVKNLSFNQKLLAVNYALDQVGKKFNWLNFIGLSYMSEKRVACNEVVRNSLMRAGQFLKFWAPSEFAHHRCVERIA